jgi:hypothetical protein
MTMLKLKAVFSFSPDTLSFSPPQTFVFSTEQALFGIVNLTNSAIITHGTNLGLFGHTIPWVSPAMLASNQLRWSTLPRVSAEIVACHQ